MDSADIPINASPTRETGTLPETAVTGCAKETEARLAQSIHRAVAEVVGSTEAERLVHLASETPRIGEGRDESPVEKVQRLRRTKRGRERLRQVRTWADVPLA